MGILFIDSNKKFLDEMKALFGDGHYYVDGLNDSLMLLESVTEFDLAVSNYNLAMETGKDLHENFRMLPETENLTILFYLDKENEIIIKNLMKMSAVEWMISTDSKEIKSKIDSILSINNKNESSQTAIDDLFNKNSDAEITKVTNDDDIFAQMMGEAKNTSDSFDSNDFNNLDFDSLKNSSSNENITNDDDIFAQLKKTESNQRVAESILKQKKGEIFRSNISKKSFQEILEETTRSSENIFKIEVINNISDEKCVIIIKDDTIVSVDMAEFEPEDALFWVLSWDSGDIEITIGDDNIKENTTIPLEEIIQDVVLKQKEFEELSETLPSFETILKLNPTFDSSSEAEYRDIIQAFDDGKTINDVLHNFKDNSLYALAIISRLYVNEILIESEKNSLDSTTNSTEDYSSHFYSNDDDSEDLLSQYGIDESLLSDIKSENPEFKTTNSQLDIGNKESNELKIATDVLESQEIDYSIDKESYIKSVVDSFKYDKQIEFTKKPQMFLLIAMGITFATIAILIYSTFIKEEPKQTIIQRINKEEHLVKKIEVLNLGLENRVQFYKESYKGIEERIKSKLFKNYQIIAYDKEMSERKYGKQLREADFFIKKGNYKKAISIYNTLLKTMPEHPELLFYLATAFYLDENNKEALNVVEKLDIIGYKNSNYTLLKGQIYQALNDLTNAEIEYSKYIQENPNSALTKELSIIIKSLQKNNKQANR
ncbi:hypothetical protein JXR93_03950 [bacterium]|nr:hypothetical protein [bacterium]